MQIEQFYDIPLAHASYAIISNGEMAVVDPGRDPEQYYQFAERNNARITTVIETHPHADFVSSHSQIHDEKGATIYVSSRVGAEYPHREFDDGETIELGEITLKSIFTPGHSPDSISVLAIDEKGKTEAVFTGDSLFIGDCGRPDLRENVGNLQGKRLQLAQMMYHTLRDKFLNLPDETKVFPAHGAGSLCGKNLSDARMSTIGAEKVQNWSLQDMTEEEFTDQLLDGQPFIPHYFGHAVEMNKAGAPHLDESLKSLPQTEQLEETNELIIDTRKENVFKKGHNVGAINIQYSPRGKFETWLGAVIRPDEKFHVIAEDEETREAVLERIAKIGYEGNVLSAAIQASEEKEEEEFNQGTFTANPENFTIVDIRQNNELASGKFFKNAMHIPLSELRERASEVQTDKPIVVHCAGGYRSTTGESILQNILGVEVYDMGSAVRELKGLVTA